MQLSPQIRQQLITWLLADLSWPAIQENARQQFGLELELPFFSQCLADEITRYLAMRLDHLAATVETLAGKPLPPAFDAVFVKLLKLHLFELVARPALSPEQIALLVAWHVKLQTLEIERAKAGRRAFNPSGHPPNHNLGIPPATLAAIEKQLKLR
ncbi:MAG: hypothetical protein WCO56_03580 [Verrucomicrobiota bacterium]